jgi:hypothetical protein
MSSPDRHEFLRTVEIFTELTKHEFAALVERATASPAFSWLQPVSQGITARS